MAHAGTPPRRRHLTPVPPFQYLLLSLVVFMVLQPYMLHGRMGSLLFATSEGALPCATVLTRACFSLPRAQRGSVSERLAAVYGLSPKPQAGPARQPSCGRRAAGRAHGQPPGAGLGRRPVARGGNRMGARHWWKRPFDFPILEDLPNPRASRRITRNSPAKSGTQAYQSWEFLALP